MMDLMYIIPSDESIVGCRITKEAVDGTEEPVLTHGERVLPGKKKKRTRNTNDDIA